MTLLTLLCAIIIIFSVLPGALAASSCLEAPQATEKALSNSLNTGVDLAAGISLEVFT